MRRPVFIAQQARDARGLIGRILAFLMAQETWAQNRRVIDALGVVRGDLVLDIGCGPGRSLQTLASLAQEGRIVGADPSALMAELAVRRNSALVRARRVEIVMASAASLPFADAAFDKALCVHVLYFWDDLDRAFAEIARVLKPGGKLALSFRTNADAKAMHAFPAEVYRFPSLNEVIASLEGAGLAVEKKRRARDFAPPARSKEAGVNSQRSNPSFQRSVVHIRKVCDRHHVRIVGIKGHCA
jgi:ubiquinone/menaquinone biosynthesis C-methylase UbiE